MPTFTERLYQSAAKAVASRGADVVFDTTSTESFDETAEAAETNASSITGKAVEVPGDPEIYAGLELIHSEPVTLIFIPSVIGSIPPLGSTVAWAGVVRTVRDRMPYRPAGIAVAARLILV